MIVGFFNLNFNHDWVLVACFQPQKGHEVWLWHKVICHWLSFSLKLTIFTCIASTFRQLEINWVKKTECLEVRDPSCSRNRWEWDTLPAQPGKLPHIFFHFQLPRDLLHGRPEAHGFDAHAFCPRLRDQKFIPVSSQTKRWSTALSLGRAKVNKLVLYAQSTTKVIYQGDPQDSYHQLSRPQQVVVFPPRTGHNQLSMQSYILTYSRLSKRDVKGPESCSPSELRMTRGPMHEPRQRP